MADGITINPYLALDPQAGLAQPSPIQPDNPAAGYTAAGMGFSILGGLLKGMSLIQSGNYNADTADRNAKLALLAGGDARARGAIAAQVLLLRGSQLASKQKAAYAGAGVDVNSGSAVDVQADTKSMSAFDALMAENNAAREAWGFEQKAKQSDEEAKIDRATSMNQAGESILGGIEGAATYGIQRHLQFA